MKGVSCACLPPVRRGALAREVRPLRPDPTVPGGPLALGERPGSDEGPAVSVAGARRATGRPIRLSRGDLPPRVSSAAASRSGSPRSAGRAKPSRSSRGPAEPSARSASRGAAPRRPAPLVERAGEEPDQARELGERYPVRGDADSVPPGAHDHRPRRRMPREADVTERRSVRRRSPLRPEHPALPQYAHRHCPLSTEPLALDPAGGVCAKMSR